MKKIKRLMLPVLLIISFNGQADSDTVDKLNCAADAIVFNLMFEDKHNSEIPTQKERIAIWDSAITGKLIESGKSTAEAKHIIEDAVNKSKEGLASIFKDNSKTKTEQKENFNNWWLQTTRCIKKYSNTQ